MRLQNIQAFLSVARLGSLRSAAKHIGVSQPALTKSIQQLEKDLGSVLFTRGVKGAVLTEAGSAFFARAEVAWNELTRGQSELEQLAGRQGGSISVGISAAPALIGLADSLTRFRMEFPDVKLRVVAGNLPAVLQEMRGGVLDFSIGPRPYSPISDDYVVETLFTNTRAVAARPGHPLRDAKHLSDLLKAEWVVTGGTGRTILDHRSFFEQHSLEPPLAVVECEYVTALLAILAGTDMLAMLPRQWVEASFAAGLLIQIPIKETLVDADICVVYRSGLSLTPAAQEFLVLMKRHIEYYLTAQAGN